VIHTEDAPACSSTSRAPYSGRAITGSTPTGGGAALVEPPPQSVAASMPTPAAPNKVVGDDSGRGCAASRRESPHYRAQLGQSGDGLEDAEAALAAARTNKPRHTASRVEPLLMQEMPMSPVEMAAKIRAGLHPLPAKSSCQPASGTTLAELRAAQRGR